MKVARSQLRVAAALVAEQSFKVKSRLVDAVQKAVSFRPYSRHDSGGDVGVSTRVTACADFEVWD